MWDILDNNTLVVFVLLLVVLYILLSDNIQMQQYIKKTFNNVLFRIIFLSLVLIYIFNKSPCVIIFIALVYVLSYESIKRNEVNENFAYLNALKKII